MPTPVTSLAALNLVAPQVTGDTLSIDSSVLSYIVQADINTVHLEVLIFNTTISNDNPLVVSGSNQFTGSIGIDQTQTSTLVQFRGRNYNPANTWTANTAFAEGFRFVDPNGNVQVVIQAGTSGSSQPVWNTSLNGITNDTLLGGTLQWQNVGPVAITPTLKFTLLFFNSDSSLVIAPPSAIRAYKGQSSCKIEWAQPPYPGTIGVRVMISTDQSGVNIPFLQFGDLVNNITRTANFVTAASTSTAVTGDTQTVTTVDQIQVVNFSSVIIPQASINADEFFVLLSTVIQDPGTNAVFESQQAGPITGGFVDLKKVSPTDFLALARKEDIAARLIQQVTRRYPDLDLTARAELRDLFIDPFALEIANMNVREWFSRVATSISAINQIDDANGDGLSDSFDQSPIKQQLSRAYGLNAADTQKLIDKQFDILGEQAGLTRGTATPAVVTLTFFTFVKPTQAVTIPVGALVSTVPDNETPALNFTTTGSASLTPQNADTFYDPVNGFWALRVPATCQTTGAAGNVGARTIRNPLSGVPNGWNVTNLLAADFGLDVEVNADFAARIADKLVTGVDSGTRHGYLSAALKTPGIIAANVIAAGDLEMLRDWDPIRQKHVFGTVDIYVRGTTTSEQNESVVFTYNNTSDFGAFTNYLTLTLSDASILKFSIAGLSKVPFPLYTPVELRVSRASNSFFLGVDRAIFDNNHGTIILNPSDQAYQFVGDNVSQAKVPLILNGIAANNATAIQALNSAQPGTYTYQLLARESSPLQDIPAFQPVLGISSISGPFTGVIDPTITRLIHVNDFLLNGGSNQAGDQIAVNSTVSVPITKTITALSAQPVQIDSAMDVSVNSNGVLQNVLSVRSTDLSTLYTFNIDYTIVPLARYHTYGLNLLPGSAITNTQQVVVAYNKFVVFERLSFISGETVTLNSNVPSPLAQKGFVHNTWLPESYGRTDLTLDAVPVFNADGSLNPIASQGLINALIPHDNRYIKVVFNNKVMRENIDFSLTVDSVSGAATIARILTGAIPDGVVVTVSYFALEVFSIATTYPPFVQILTNAIAVSKHAAGDVLVKAMLANPVDATFTVELAPDAAPETVDARIRNVISIVMNKAQTKLPQSEVVRQVKSVQGIVNIQLPLIKFAKSDGSYDVGVVVPTQTAWTPLSQDPNFNNRLLPQNSFISPIVLPDNTIPGGGLPDSFVGFLFEGQEFRRASSVQDFLNSGSTPSFYIIGTNDQVDANTPLPTSSYAKRVLLTEAAGINPALRSYRATYQVFGEGGAKDISVSSTEFIVPGLITINYITSGS